MEELLLAWFDEHGRDLPWRHTRDPYAILVSEVMAQQTQLERVLPRWERWMERWPTVESLAAAMMRAAETELDRATLAASARRFDRAVFDDAMLGVLADAHG